ncbi:MAG: PD-(D/E)XK nuclease family protein, partial [Candidatus Nanoarchaeia archaeon]
CLSEREILIRGKIDRIDVTPDGKFALVIDYKTGKRFKASSLENGTCLQLPLYLLAAKNLLGLEPLGGHLYSFCHAKLYVVGV